jgi:TolB protein
MTHTQLINKGFLYLVLIALLTTCTGPQTAVNETWTILELMTQVERTDKGSEIVDVRNCGIAEQKVTSCSAGTSNNFSVSLGGGIKFGEGLSGSIDTSVSTGLGIGRESGESLTLEAPPDGFIYRYTVNKEYHVITGQILARSSSGNEQRVDYAFRANCSITLVSQIQLGCTDIQTTPPTTLTPPTDTQSPIGSIFFESTRDGNSEIYRYDFSTSTFKRITDNTYHDSWPSTSPDGRTLCFETDRTGNLKIFCTDFEGNNPINLTNNSGEEGMPRFSPDGTMIAYHQRETNGSAWNIWVMNADGRNKRQLTNENSYMGEPAWFPGGDKLVFDGDKPDRNILEQNLDGTGLTVVNNQPGEQRSPSVSSDGQFIYYDSSQSGNFQIYRMRVDGSEQIAITSVTGDNILPQVSLDGKWLMFMSNQEGNWEIYLCRIDGSDLKRLITSSGDNIAASWATP